MTTDVVSAAPAGIGSPPNLATGSFVADGNATSITCGFNPRDVLIIDETAGSVYRKIQGNSVNACIKNGAVDATSGEILFPADAGLNEPGASVLLAASLCVAGHTIAWAVYG